MFVGAVICAVIGLIMVNDAASGMLIGLPVGFLTAVPATFDYDRLDL